MFLADYALKSGCFGSLHPTRMAAILLVLPLCLGRQAEESNLNYSQSWVVLLENSERIIVLALYYQLLHSTVDKLIYHYPGNKDLLLKHMCVCVGERMCTHIWMACT